jgi:hypothetical protein
MAEKSAKKCGHTAAEVDEVWYGICKIKSDWNLRSPWGHEEMLTVFFMFPVLLFTLVAAGSGALWSILNFSVICV